MPKRSVPVLPDPDYFGHAQWIKIGSNKNSAKREFNRLVLSTPYNRRYQLLIEATFVDKNKREPPRRLGKTFGSRVGNVRKGQSNFCASYATEVGEKPNFDKMYEEAIDYGYLMAAAGDNWDEVESGGHVNKSRSRWVLGTIHAVHIVIWRTLKRPKRGKTTKGGLVQAPDYVKPLVLKYKSEKKPSKKELEEKYATPKSRARAFKRLQEKNIAMEQRAFKRKKSK